MTKLQSYTIPKHTFKSHGFTSCYPHLLHKIPLSLWSLLCCHTPFQLPSYHPLLLLPVVFPVHHSLYKLPYIVNSVLFHNPLFSFMVKQVLLICIIGTTNLPCDHLLPFSCLSSCPCLPFIPFSLHSENTNLFASLYSILFYSVTITSSWCLSISSCKQIYLSNHYERQYQIILAFI